jgi:hypothetical protein
MNGTSSPLHSPHVHRGQVRLCLFLHLRLFLVRQLPLFFLVYVTLSLLPFRSHPPFVRFLTHRRPWSPSVAR